MATGSGFTTLCEVVVKPGDTNKFEIDPYPREEVERTIDDFCMNTWVKVYPDSFDGGQKGSGGEPFDEHVEGLIDCGNETCAIERKGAITKSRGWLATE